MTLFAYDPMLRRAIAANSGWYTAPDSTIAYPWGVKHQYLSITRGDLNTYVSRNLIIMRGTADTVRDANLNTDPLSDAQGKNRYQRAGYFFAKGSEYAPFCRWQISDVVGSGHDYLKMATAAGAYILGLTPVVHDAAAPHALGQVMKGYPNPFNASSVTVFSVTEPAHTTVVVYSMLGEKVCTLADEYLPPGVYRKSFDGTPLAAGMYFCRILSGGQSSVLKLLLLK